VPKALFLGLPLHGHVNPTLPLVRALVERGHDITYYARPNFAAAVEHAGARCQPYGGGHLDDPERLFADTAAISSRLMRAASGILETHLDAFRGEHPDYIITDSLAPWGQWAGLILGVPVVTSVSTFAINRHVMKFSAAHGIRPASIGGSLSKLRHLSTAFMLGRRLRRTYRVAGPGPVRSVLGRSGLNIVYTSRYFQPCAETFDERFQFVGPSVGDRASVAVAADDLPGDGPLVYVSLGTIFNSDRRFYQHCFDAFADQPFRVLMSTGAAVAPASLGFAPSNFTVLPHVPQLAVLQRAAAFVTHGGMNSVSESLHYGVPIVAVPQTGEQALVGRRAEQLNAGLFLAKDEAGPSQLRDAVLRVLHDDRFRRAAAAVRRSFDEAGGAANAADGILAFVSRSRRLGAASGATPAV
jgi:MGT family glycosyltransferase